MDRPRGQEGHRGEQVAAEHDVALEAAVSRLSLEPSVSSVTWNTREPAALLATEE